MKREREKERERKRERERELISRQGESGEAEKYTRMKFGDVERER